MGTLACLAFIAVCWLIIHRVQAKKQERGEDVISPVVRHFDRIRAEQRGADADTEAPRADDGDVAAR